ncbi:b40 [miniopterid betaherpesvirus 1]|uniref:B40 n=1 Tax=miniopterid betaherpesvirus 1 TaxID=3070189 RepID=I3VQ21_9BETA|nr:b40 [miniopterid betaherpesvirus 1]AFK83865.1 b40 [miniopterid betaherpesvirus 1]
MSILLAIFLAGLCSRSIGRVLDRCAIVSSDDQRYDASYSSLVFYVDSTYSPASGNFVAFDTSMSFGSTVLFGGNTTYTIGNLIDHNCLSFYDKLGHLYHKVSSSMQENLVTRKNGVAVYDVEAPKRLTVAVTCSKWTSHVKVYNPDEGADFGLSCIVQPSDTVCVLGEGYVSPHVGFTRSGYGELFNRTYRSLTEKISDYLQTGCREDYLVARKFVIDNDVPFHPPEMLARNYGPLKRNIGVDYAFPGKKLECSFMRGVTYFTENVKPKAVCTMSGPGVIGTGELEIIRYGKKVTPEMWGAESGNPESLWASIEAGPEDVSMSCRCHSYDTGRSMIVPLPVQNTALVHGGDLFSAHVLLFIVNGLACVLAVVLSIVVCRVGLGRLGRRRCIRRYQTSYDDDAPLLMPHKE